MRTTLYLLRHGATEANLARPARLQGRRHDTPLAELGIRQAEATRDLLAIRPIDACFCSPLARAVETARIVGAAHGLTPQPVDELTECDVGRWEGLDWETIRQSDPDGYRRFMANPAENGYPGGETFGDVALRAGAGIDRILSQHAGRSLLVVAHHVVNRTYLAGLLGLSPGHARQVRLDTCGISVVIREGDRSYVSTLNAAFHLQGVATAA
jgi:broad specificity phosphatase PhoE